MGEDRRQAGRDPFVRSESLSGTAGTICLDSSRCCSDDAPCPDELERRQQRKAKHARLIRTRDHTESQRAAASAESERLASEEGRRTQQTRLFRDFSPGMLDDAIDSGNDYSWPDHLSR